MFTYGDTQFSVTSFDNPLHQKSILQLFTEVDNAVKVFFVSEYGTLEGMAAEPVIQDFIRMQFTLKHFMPVLSSLWTKENRKFLPTLPSQNSDRASYATVVLGAIKIHNKIREQDGRATHDIVDEWRMLLRMIFPYISEKVLGDEQAFLNSSNEPKDSVGSLVSLQIDVQNSDEAFKLLESYRRASRTDSHESKTELTHQRMIRPLLDAYLPPSSDDRRDDSVRPGLPLEGQIAETLVQLRAAHQDISVRLGVMGDLIGHLTQQLHKT